MLFSAIFFILLKFSIRLARFCEQCPTVFCYCNNIHALIYKRFGIIHKILKPMRGGTERDIQACMDTSVSVKREINHKNSQDVRPILKFRNCIPFKK